MAKFRISLLGGGVNRVSNEAFYKGCTPIHSAIMNNKVDFLKFLVEKKADINAKVVSSGNTPLHIAANDNKKDLVEYLLKKGANIEETNNRRMTPLQHAIQNNGIDAVQSLLAGGADVSIKTETGESCLHLAAKTGNAPLIKIFLDRRLSPNARNGNEWTPLFFACAGGHLDAVKILVENGGDIRHEFSFYKMGVGDVKTSALELAKKAKNPSLITFLQSKGAH